jgi:hypothetical protein
MARITKLSPAPVPYPNGGAIKAMAVSKQNVYKAQRDELDAKHNREREELEFKIKEDAKKQNTKGKPSASKASAKTKVSS